jgi:NDP-mannose synthase
MKAVIQAGGKGTRLRPYTLIMPKPLMPVGESPVLEVLLKWLRRWDIHEVYITTGHLGHLIRALCGDGNQWDMDIKYTEELEPMGTVGALSHLREHLTETFLMLNGDLITDLDLENFTAFHKKNKGPITVACTDKVVNIDFGVIDNGDGHRITGFKEKPKLRYQVSMGIYCMEPSILKLIPDGVPFGFDNLMHSMLKQGLPVYVYEHSGLWMDIGNEDDFNNVQQSFTGQYKSLILGC